MRRSRSQPRRHWGSDSGLWRVASAWRRHLVASRGQRRNTPRTATTPARRSFLAIVFVSVVSVTLLALISMSGNDIKSSVNLESERSLEYAAAGATNAAIRAVRYSYYAFNGTTGHSSDDCLPDGAAFTNPDGNTTSMTLNGIVMRVDCSGTLNAGSQNTRVVTFDACNLTTCTSARTRSSSLPWGTSSDYSTSGTYQWHLPRGHLLLWHGIRDRQLDCRERQLMPSTKWSR